MMKQDEEKRQAMIRAYRSPWPPPVESANTEPMPDDDAFVKRVQAKTQERYGSLLVLAPEKSAEPKQFEVVRYEAERCPSSDHTSVRIFWKSPYFEGVRESTRKARTE